MALKAIIDSIYQALENDNQDLDIKISELKSAMKENNIKEAEFEAAKLAQNNRQGRKLMQAYFRQRGVSVKFI
ncbi:hypothetical protein [Pseudaquidulcibacter saccharophilus]|uniref:hypothetical protein n=1 Tax=Pseudaquidulcibacter saccharophilus TaxID=2831900 RepID=UPI001EFF3C9A|nr:hypothetical protein [Pseudaquidulcibacter saccharophilus]